MSGLWSATIALAATSEPHSQSISGQLSLSEATLGVSLSALRTWLLKVLQVDHSGPAIESSSANGWDAELQANCLPVLENPGLEEDGVIRAFKILEGRLRSL